jgi:o-succinylbenzoate synthase
MGLTFKAYTLDFLKPLITSSGVMKTRDSLILEWNGPKLLKAGLMNSNSVVRSEAAPLPLPGFSTESVSDCIDWITLFSSELDNYLNEVSMRYFEGFQAESFTTVENFRSRVSSFFQKESSSSPVPESLPSIRFACDSLLLVSFINRDLFFGTNTAKSINYNNGKRLPPVPVNALAGNIHMVQELVDCGFKTIKFKVGINPEEELHNLLNFRATYPDIGIRLDANAAWSLEQARYWLARFSKIAPDYLEQPVGRQELFDNLGELKGYGVPLAADESLRNIEDFKRFDTHNLPDAAIIKPMVINGLNETFRLIESCVELGVTPVLTSTLESGITRRILARIASIHGLHTHAHGLATGSLLANDPFDDSKLIANGFYHIEASS